mgnify:CR=1 FL=1
MSALPSPALEAVPLLLVTVGDYLKPCRAQGGGDLVLAAVYEVMKTPPGAMKARTNGARGIITSETMFASTIS